ncbi:DUF6777 domain-containing protein [Yinghuangia seranimata]|uniref:DUF6777 domain-containing protein n=1 Tax=Yinghuangia seranimata TaxID=408067 RepID=UPI00248B427F|nr:DUF6777 domain-containing protein [Yinghuangia seranimata]MDI2128333.1 hypothetical protein [Yinghuangia seranimata]
MAVLLVLALLGASGSCRGSGDRVLKVVAEQIRDIAFDAFFDRLIGQDRPGVVPGPATGTRPGDTQGAVGDGSLRAEPLCDIEQLIRFLTDPANSRVAGVWADEAGVPVSRIPTYVRGLTPVVLRNDTLVTNHNYKDGKAKSYESLLQAGTVVLDDEFGVPRVKCNCGNPLKPPQAQPGSIEVSISDPGWAARYNPAQVTRFTPASTPMTSFYLADLDTGAGLRRPTGTRGEKDQPAPAPPPPPAPSTKSTKSTKSTTSDAKPAVEQIAGRWTYGGGERQSYPLPDGTSWEIVLDRQNLEVTARGSFTLDITAHITTGPVAGAPIRGQCTGTVKAERSGFVFQEQSARVTFQGQEVTSAELGGLGCGDLTANVQGAALVVTDATGLRVRFTRAA